MTGAVGGVTRTADGCLAVVACVATESTLVDLAFGRAVERQTHLLEVEHRIDGLLGHDLDGVLVGEVVAALDGVEGVPLPVVFLHVRQCGTHAALGRAGVAAGGVELGQYGRAGTGASFDCRTHACATGADDDHVITMFLHEVCAPLARRDIGSKVKMTYVPRPMIRIIERTRIVVSQKRVESLRE